MKSCYNFALAFLFFLFSFHNSYSQNQNKIDSLIIALDSDIEDTIKVSILNSLFVHIKIADPEKALSYAQEMILLAESIKDQFGKASALNNLGLHHLNRSEYDQAAGFFNKSLEIRIEINDKEGIAESYNNIGSVYDNLGEFEKALDHQTKALQINIDLADERAIAITYAHIGITYDHQGKYELALKNYLKALSKLEELNYTAVLGGMYNNVGEVYRSTKKYDLALEYYSKSLQVKQWLGDKKGVAMTLNNKAIVYYYQGKIDKTLEMFYSSLEIREEIDDKKGMAQSYSNIGEVLTEKGEFKKAVVYLNKALQIHKLTGDRLTMVNTLSGLGNLHQVMGNKQAAIKYYQQSVELAKELGIKEELESIYLQLSLLYENAGQYSKAFEYHQLYVTIKDSIFNEASAKSMNEMQTKYESEKKEKEIDMLTKDNELQVLKTAQQEDQIRKQRLLIVGIIFILGLAISLIYVVYSQFKFKKQANYELEFKNDQLGMVNQDLDRKNRSIAESINYAQRIQETIMPTQTHLNEIFPESFIFYKAKDVVSGDFPWVWASLDGKGGVCVSAVDCTGHGVPGAMLSMIGYFLLNDIVASKKMHNPAIILEELHNGIKETLRQEENLESKDGMDIAFCTINKQNREVQYAGAHRSLLWLHNNEIEEIRGDRFPVGGLQYSSRGKKIKFKNHQLQLEEGDSIYFYSDGLIDQIGGPKSRRFQNSQVKEIIIENKDKPMGEMKNVFDERFLKWMGNEKQLDDVIMIGIKV
ncbi:MAG: hypothetical protein COC01_07870 [Bacteroidetes bacterium]|nr:MAG: hypothetical protein COC01_07870 [Bacteroidota bacterium]